MKKTEFDRRANYENKKREIESEINSLNGMLKNAKDPALIISLTQNIERLRLNVGSSH